MCLSCDMRQGAHDTGHMRLDIWHVEGGEHRPKISASYIKRFGSYDILKDWEEKGRSLTESMNDNGVCRAAPATSGRLIIDWVSESSSS